MSHEKQRSSSFKISEHSVRYSGAPFPEEQAQLLGDAVCANHLLELLNPSNLLLNSNDQNALLFPVENLGVTMLDSGYKATYKVRHNVPNGGSAIVTITREL